MLRNFESPFLDIESNPQQRLEVPAAVGLEAEDDYSSSPFTSEDQERYDDHEEKDSSGYVDTEFIIGAREHASFESLDADDTDDVDGELIELDIELWADLDEESETTEDWEANEAEVLLEDLENGFLQHGATQWETEVEPIAREIGSNLLSNFSSGVHFAIYDPGHPEFQRRSNQWAEREEAVGFDHRSIQPANLVLGKSVRDSLGLVRTVGLVSAKLEQEVSRARHPDSTLPFPGTGPNKIRTLAIFSHGWDTTLAIGNDLTAGNVDEVFRKLAPALANDVTVALYGCSISANPGESGWVTGTMDAGGELSLSARIRDALVDQGKTLASVWGHTEVGHTTRNPALRVFYADARHPMGGGKGTKGRPYAGEIVYGSEWSIAANDLEQAIMRRGYRVIESARQSFQSYVFSVLRKHFYRAYVRTVVKSVKRRDGSRRRKTNLILRGGSLPEMTPMYPQEVAEIQRNYWKNTYWTRKKQSSLARSVIRKLRRLKVITKSRTNEVDANELDYEFTYEGSRAFEPEDIDLEFNETEFATEDGWDNFDEDEFIEELDIADTLEEKNRELYEEFEHEVVSDDEDFNEELEGEGEGFESEYEREENLYPISESEYEESEKYDLDAETLFESQEFGNKEPIPIPINRPVPFASPPPLGSYWPLLSTHRRGKEVAFQYKAKPSRYVGNRSRCFLARRSSGSRYHVGIDLYANYKDEVVACEDGVIINFYHFYRSTYALIIEHENVVINYGEVHKDSLKANGLKKGDRVTAGQVIGFAGKMYKSSMLHFEVYRKGTTRNLRWLKKNDAPYKLLNPTKYLLFLKEHGNITNRNIDSSRPGSSIEITPTINFRKAIYLNNRYSKKYGWGKFRDKINDLLGIVVKGNNRSFAEAVANWQEKAGFIGKDVDGIVGRNTWSKMKANLNLDSYPHIADTHVDIQTDNTGTILDKINDSRNDHIFSEGKLAYVKYSNGDLKRITPEAVLWLAKMIDAETWGKPTEDDARSMLWALVQRTAIWKFRKWSWVKMIQAYSQPINPRWTSSGDKCTRYYKSSFSGTIPERCSVRRVNRRTENIRKKWNDVHPIARRVVLEFIAGKIPNHIPGVVGWFAPGTWKSRERNGANKKSNMVYHSTIDGNVYFMMNKRPDTTKWTSSEVIILNLNVLPDSH